MISYYVAGFFVGWLCRHLFGKSWGAFLVWVSLGILAFMFDQGAF